MSVAAALNDADLGVDALQPRVGQALLDAAITASALRCRRRARVTMAGMPLPAASLIQSVRLARASSGAVRR